MSTKLFVGNLNETTSAPTVGKLFETIGAVKNATIETRNEISRGFGYVELSTEEDAKAALERLNGYELEGRRIRVEVARDRSQPLPRRERGGRPFRGGRRGGMRGRYPPRFGGQFPYAGFQQQYSDFGYGPRRFPGRRFGARRGRRPTRRQLNPDAPTSQTRVHIGNLPYTLTKNELAEQLKGFQIKEIVLAHRRFNTSLNVGYAFVDFATPAEQKRFLETNQVLKLKDRDCRSSPAMDVPASAEQ